MKTKQELLDFEEKVANLFNNAKIRSPVHLSGGNEEECIELFKDIKPEDWVFTTYRSHYHALCKGMPEKDLMEWILSNKSIHLMSKKYKMVSSAIVGGTIPQAVGAAMAIKINKEERRVWCICGDMTSTLGTFHDCWQFAKLNHLPITFIIEDNGLSTDTPTEKAWSQHYGNPARQWVGQPHIIYYKYERTRPHYGAGKFVNFDKT